MQVKFTRMKLLLLLLKHCRHAYMVTWQASCKATLMLLGSTKIKPWVLRNTPQTCGRPPFHRTHFSQQNNLSLSSFQFPMSQNFDPHNLLFFTHVNCQAYLVITFPNHIHFFSSSHNNYTSYFSNYFFFSFSITKNPNLFSWTWIPY